MPIIADHHRKSENPLDCWKICRSGSFYLLDANGRDVTPKGKKARAILAYLVSHGDSRIGREKLAELLWGDRGEHQARASLRQSLLEIRHCCDDLLVSDREHVWIDYTRLIEDDGVLQSHPDAILFDDLTGITPEFDNWLHLERAQQNQRLWDELSGRAEKLLAERDYSAVLSLVERMRAIDPYNEDWLRLAMRAESGAGHPAGIETRFKQMEEILHRDLDVSISAQSRALHDDLLTSLPRPQRSTNEEPPQPQLETWTGPPARKGKKRIFAYGLATVFAAANLAHSAQTADPGQQRIAVIPFRAIDVESDLADGISEDMLTTLSQRAPQEIVGRTSSWLFKDKAADLRQIGRRLDVDYVVEGSVRQMSSTLQLTVALVNTQNGTRIWSGRFDSPSGNVQKLELFAGRALLRELGVEGGLTSRAAHPEAYTRYIRAKSMIRERNWEKMRQAHDLLREAVALDPDFAPAWAQLAAAIRFLARSYPSDRVGETGDWQKDSRDAARRAIALDPNLAEGHAAMAFAIGWDRREGRDHLRRALQIDPKNAQTLYWWGGVMQRAGRNRQQYQYTARALAADPYWHRPIEVIAVSAIEQGRPQVADQLLQRLRSVDSPAAIEVEMAIARAKGDLSRVVEIGRGGPQTMAVNATTARVTLAWTLIELGYVREGLLLGDMGQLERWAQLRELPGRAALLEAANDYIGDNEEPEMLASTILELARTGRHADVAALYDLPGSSLPRLATFDDGNRFVRLGLAAVIGHSMLQLDRKDEAQKLFRSATEAIRVMLSEEPISSAQLIAAAIGESFMGRRENALRLLERAARRGGYRLEESTLRLEETPGLDRLRGDPRFERIKQEGLRRLMRERRETEALSLV